jgi:hypothetical protein
MRKIEKPGPNGEVADEKPLAGRGTLRGSGVPAVRAPDMALLDPGKMPDTPPPIMVAESIAVADAAAATAEMAHVCRRRELKVEVPAAVGMPPMEAPVGPPPEPEPVTEPLLVTEPRPVAEPSVAVALESSSPAEPVTVTEPSVPVALESSSPPEPEPEPEPVPVTEPSVRVLLEASWLTVWTMGAVAWLTVWTTGAAAWLIVWVTGAAVWLTVWTMGAAVSVTVWVTGAAAWLTVWATGAAAWVTGVTAWLVVGVAGATLWLTVWVTGAAAWATVVTAWLAVRVPALPTAPSTGPTARAWPASTRNAIRNHKTTPAIRLAIRAETRSNVKGC